MLNDDDLLAAIETDYETAALSNAQIQMLRYTEKLTRTPQLMIREDVRALRDSGFTDADILHIAEVASYYAYVNRIADGLGVEVEDDP